MANDKNTSNTSYKERNSVISFLVSLLAGAASIYLGALVVFGVADFTTAILAALIGAVVWGIVSFFIGWIPLLGSIVTFIVWLGVINWFYPGGWWEAAQVAALAWLASTIIVYVIRAISDIDSTAKGVPGR